MLGFSLRAILLGFNLFNLLHHLLCRYGASTGAPTEVNIYADVEAAWRCLTERYGVSAENIVLYGQSIGTVPTVDLASRVKVAGVVLHSPLTSGVRVAFPDTKQTWFFDAFPRLINYIHVQSCSLYTLMVTCRHHVKNHEDHKR